MKKWLWLVLIVATVGVAAIFFLRWKKRADAIESEPERAPDGSIIPTPAAVGYPVFPMILVSSVMGLAAKTKNLGNLRVSGDKWQGKEGELDGFEAFKDWAYGVRALLKTLLTYYNKHGLKTITKIISRYAPTSENNTKGYIQNVMLWTKINPDVALNQSDLVKVAWAIIRMEVGMTDKDMPYLKTYVEQVNDYFKVL